MDKVTNSRFIQKVASYDSIKQLSSKVGQQPELVALAVSVLVGLLIMVTSLGRCVVFTAVFFFYPSYKSFKAVDSGDMRRIQKWLVYWTSFGFVYVFQSVVVYFLGWIWGIEILRAVLLVYVLHPRTDGDQVLYDSVIEPMVTKYRQEIDRFVHSARSSVKDKFEQGKAYAGDKVVKNLLKTEKTE